MCTLVFARYNMANSWTVGQNYLHSTLHISKPKQPNIKAVLQYNSINPLFIIAFNNIDFEKRFNPAVANG